MSTAGTIDTGDDGSLFVEIRCVRDCEDQGEIS